MSDQTAAAPAAGAQEPQVGTTQAAQTQQPATQPAAPAAGGTASVEELQSQLERERTERQQANREAQTMRARLRELETAEAKRQEATLSEQEKLQKQLAELQQQQASWQAERRDLVTRTAVTAEAQRVGIVDPDAAVRLLDASAIEYAEDGTPRNIPALIEALAKAKPYLVQPGASPGNPARGGPGDPAAREAELRQLLNGGVANPFDVARAQGRGGGVTIREG